MSKPRPYTSEEMRQKFMQAVAAASHYWETIEDPKGSRVSGLVFSLLTLIDGGNAAMCGFDIVARPHPDDKQFCIDEGINYVERGQVINQCQLHELWHEAERQYKKKLHAPPGIVKCQDTDSQG